MVYAEPVLTRFHIKGGEIVSEIICPDCGKPMVCIVQTGLQKLWTCYNALCPSNNKKEEIDNGIS